MRLLKWIVVMVDEFLRIRYPDTMTTFLEKFGRQIRRLREAKGYTQEKLSELIDVAAKTISAWENGKFFLEYPSIQKLCKALEITEEDLFSFACSKEADEILALIKQLKPEQQKHIIDIIKTFIK